MVTVTGGLLLLSRDSNPDWGDWHRSFVVVGFVLFVLFLFMGNGCQCDLIFFHATWARCRAALGGKKRNMLVSGLIMANSEFQIHAPLGWWIS